MTTNTGDRSTGNFSTGNCSISNYSVGHFSTEDFSPHGWFDVPDNQKWIDVEASLSLVGKVATMTIDGVEYEAEIRKKVNCDD